MQHDTQHHNNTTPQQQHTKTTPHHDTPHNTPQHNTHNWTQQHTTTQHSNTTTPNNTATTHNTQQHATTHNNPQQHATTHNNTQHTTTPDDATTIEQQYTTRTTQQRHKTNNNNDNHNHNHNTHHITHNVHNNHHNHHVSSRRPCHCVSPFPLSCIACLLFRCRALAASQMMAGRDEGGGTGSARRRRERRLRSLLRHVRLAVAMAVAEATHHSSRGQKTATVIREVEEQAAHGGLRAQKTPPPGARPGMLAEPGAQRSDPSRRHFSGDCLPTLGLPVLAGASGEQVDSSSLQISTVAALRQRKKEEDKKAKRETVHQETQRLAAEARLLFERNKRKRKKKKRTLPKGWSPRSLPARAVRTRKYGRYFYCPGPSWCLVLPWFDRWYSSCVSLWMLALDTISSSPLCCPPSGVCCQRSRGNVVLFGDDFVRFRIRRNAWCDSGYTFCYAQCLVPQWKHICVSLRRRLGRNIPYFTCQWTSDPGIWHSSCQMPGSTLDSCSASVPRYFGIFFTNFLREGVDSDPEVAAVLLHAADEPLVSGTHLLSACLARGI